MLKLLLPLLFFLPLMAKDPGFYVWQRQQDAKVEKAVGDFCKESDGRLYFLAGEMENNGRMIRISPPGFIPFARSVPVFRIHINNMKLSPAILAEKIAGAYKAWQLCQALQIDLDCPEAKLDYYTTLMQELRKKFPGIELSATVLPCHLNHPEKFKKLAGSCDFFVLQVHALARNKDFWFILDRNIAVTAVERADRINRPYQVALPFYSHLIKGKAVYPDPEVISEIVSLTRKSRYAIGLIAFRLQLDGEYDVLDMLTALNLCRGGKYAPELVTSWEKQPGGSWLLYLENRGFFVHKTTLQCRWEKGFAIHDAKTFNRAELTVDRSKLTLFLPPPGKKMAVLWLRTDENNDLDKNNPLTVKENAEL